MVKLGVSRQVVIPKQFWQEMKLRAGEYMQVKKQGNDLVLSPKKLVDKELEAGLAQSFKDFEEGRSYGPFSAKEAVTFLHRAVKNSRNKSKKLS